MNKISMTKRARKNNTRGATLVEYIILVGCVALLAVAGFKAFGGSVSAKITKQAGQISGL